MRKGGNQNMKQLVELNSEWDWEDFLISDEEDDDLDLQLAHLEIERRLAAGSPPLEVSVDGGPWVNEGAYLLS